MKQVLQDLKTGATLVVDAPAPVPGPNEVLIATRASLLSAGTERMLLEFGRSGLIDKARQQPDKVRQVLDKIRTDGLVETLGAVRAKLDQPLPMGYCNAGVVVARGTAVTEFEVGQRVVSNGPHAELVRVSRNLCARIPDGVPDDEASFTVLGSIALQGLRLAAPTLGETFVVSGLGLIGLTAVQLLRANGCRVVGLDFDPARLELARRFGARTVALGDGVDPVQEVLRATDGRGADGVLIAASTSSSDPVRQAAQMSRKRGRIVLLGVTGLELSRADFYEKELTFQVSCSYGPGRYDPAYEERGQDYPLGFVRWTEQRNFAAVLDAIAERRLDVRPMLTHRFPIADAGAAYDALASDRNALGIVLEYPASGPAPQQRSVAVASRPIDRAQPVLAAIGGGNYASRVLLPAFQAAGFDLHTLVTTGSAQTVPTAGKLGFRRAATDVTEALGEPTVSLVAIATRHDTHADLAIAALRSGKHVFVEKPLVTTREQLAALERTLAELGPAAPSLTVGFNRRFAPHVQRARTLLARRSGPRAFVYTVNAGAIPAEHWTQDPRKGGGRLVGEGCHFIDLLRFLADAPIARAQALALEEPTRRGAPPDTFGIQLAFADGSLGTIQYFANGARSFPKERLEIFAGGGVLRIDNFRRFEAFAWPGASNDRLWSQDKGQSRMAAALRDAIVAGGAPPIPLDQILEVARATLDCAEQVGTA
jgi:predicted dehydrogenase/threonine dehydrogenase-like Zn-dependent dehydrogenase